METSEEIQKLETTGNTFIWIYVSENLVVPTIDNIYFVLWDAVTVNSTTLSPVLEIRNQDDLYAYTVIS